MNRILLKMFHALPSPARNTVATLRGLHLRRWRYGADSDRLTAEALERDSWSPAQWRAWQQDRLARMLHHAATQVPYYRAQWESRRRCGDRASWELLENWPILSKEPLRENPRAFVADGEDPRRLFHEHTSGTTGKSLDLWRRRDSLQAWYALCEARMRRWYGVSRNDRWGIFGGQLVTPRRQTQPPFWVWNAALRQLYMSSYHLSPEMAQSYLRAIRRYQLTYLVGYSSSLYALACAAKTSGTKLDLKVIVTNAEPLLPWQRAEIEAAFECPVRETYGLAEYVAAASECEHGTLHVWPEAGYIEISGGEIVGTGLLNPEMPLIRFATGDRGSLIENSVCPCGRDLPVLAAIEGRIDDLLHTPDGRTVGRLDPVFKTALPVVEAQIIQERISVLRVRYVPAAGFDERAARSIRERIRDRMGPVEIILEPVERIERGANGKFRAVICRIPAEERQRAALSR
ncbi:MAG: hypothetical protein LAO79_28690 [Acidobacteriia bacterium]|nr:hypothetical protein [Terriglobia bacterium]